MFRTSVPATDLAFANREAELRQLAEVIEKLRQGTPAWTAIIGPRKIGKTSLVLELARRHTQEDVLLVALDSFEEMPLSLAVFRRLALRTLDAAFATEIGRALEALASSPSEYRQAFLESSRLLELPKDLRAQVLELPGRPIDEAMVRFCLELPERLAQALGLRFVVAWDEFQQLAELSGKTSTVFGLIRSVWQKHERVSYIISGSARSMLRKLVTEKESAFFQHFAVLELGPFEMTAAVELLVDASRDARPISRALAEKAVGVVGGNPFYLQLLGEELETPGGDLDEDALKQAVQDLLFSRTGRLALYFEMEFQKLVGRSTFLTATLQALAAGPMRMTDLATAIQAPTGATARYLERLGDAVVRRDDGRYALDDGTFASWLAWRQPGGTTVPMSLVGDEAERDVAGELAKMGFDLVYQSRASRGAFDLLATRGATKLGLQVKRTTLPVALASAAWKRMHAEGERLAWVWVVAVVTPQGERLFLDPTKARVGKQARLDRRAVIDNLLLWLDGRDGSPRRGRKRGPALR